jgi:hypothetical protein
VLLCKREKKQYSCFLRIYQFLKVKTIIESGKIAGLFGRYTCSNFIRIFLLSQKSSLREWTHKMTPWDWFLAVFGLAIIVSLGIVAYRVIRQEETGVPNTMIFLIISIIFLGIIVLYFFNKWGLLAALMNRPLKFKFY